MGGRGVLGVLVVAVVCVLGCGGVKLEGSSRIIDGIEESNAAQWPSVVSLALEVQDGSLSSFCTGALIDDDIVITAAHCFNSLPLNVILVCAGTVDINNNSGTCVGVSVVLRPSAYDPEIVAQPNDMAMMQLDSSLVGGSVQTVAMTFQVPIDNQVAFGVGFGVSEQGADATTDGLLRFLDKTIPPSSDCLTLTTIPGGARTDAYLCADGNWDGSRGTTCNGDSGGPLYIVTGDASTMYSVGVVSFGLTTEEESCSTTLETVYMSFTAEEHREFIDAALDEFNGSVRTVEPLTIDSTTTCDEPAVEVCMSVLRDGCSAGDSSTVHAVDCVNALIEPCSGTALASEWETLSEECTNPACMPAGEWVGLADGTSKRVEELQAGERVDTGSGSSSDVFGFTHRMADEVSVFERIEVGERAVHLSAGHYLPVGGRLKRAADVEVGDRLSLADGTNAAVTGRRRVTMRGLYHPHTLNDVMVVDGIVISTFTDTVHPSVARWLLAVPKALYRLGIKEPLGSALYRTVPRWVQSLLVKGTSEVATNLVGA